MSRVKKNSVFLVLIALVIISLAVFIPKKQKGVNLEINQEKTGAREVPSPVSDPKRKTMIKSVRIDLSSLQVPDKMDQFPAEIMARLLATGANTVFINPWSDGEANYQSRQASLSVWGENSFLESFVAQAHQAGLEVYAWFVVGRDDFPFIREPDWFAQTLTGENYYHEDEPGLFLPAASLANPEYLKYHLLLLDEVADLPIDGWVISEPLASWSDRYDADYADFSPPVLDRFINQFGFNPRTFFTAGEQSSEKYQLWVDFRAGIVTEFVEKTLEAIRHRSPKPVVITLFTEPGPDGKLKSFAKLKEWLGEDIDSLLELKPDYLEIQNLYADFEFPQKPEWATSFINQFRNQLDQPVPLMVSIQGFSVEPVDFSKVMALTLAEPVEGVSFYGFHTLPDLAWDFLREIWQN
ncbi:MAG: hypothetical protein JW991_02410 [Candidatus Pacebacteria bacterium]|nr:hypothetical protein [Candidatus Paceibacterota bacterium]